MTIADFFFTLVFLLGIAYLALWRFKQYRMDKFRQNIFALRDELFDYAAKGNISFSHPAYTTLRSLMNGYIRFSHRISLLQALFISVSYSKGRSKSFEQVWQEVSEGLDVGVKSELEVFNIRASAQLFYFVFLSSLVKKIVVIPCLLFVAFKHLILARNKKSDTIISSNKAKAKELEVTTYEQTIKHSEQIEHSIEYLNTDALAFGSAKASVALA